ncbi:hypothetical protein PORY_001176 [Pneumocystis oryctolagi]|uniref:Uncharacterized protein n=1 Tax=Pneumocystis oryctolagi TaxID=42067 RepID=A0ACB7CEY1_9ASCO|nr:hypothetical protein PORY_001176 [Pneumocystis oryctolagi]
MPETTKTELLYEKTLPKKILNISEKSKETPGIVYISKIPPFMKPETIRHLLSPYGEIKRIFLAPEDHQSYIKRIRFRGNKKKKYTEGWVEFKDKEKAKLVASILNTSIIGGKSSTYYHDDIWNIKYLPKFKWNHLQEQIGTINFGKPRFNIKIASENASRTSKLRAYISHAKRENQNYIKNYERSKMIQNIATKKQKINKNTTPNLQKETKYKFKQREVIHNIPINIKEKNEINTVLNKIF